MNSCTVLRRKLVTHSTLNVTTGERAAGASEWVTEPCGVPLFSDRECATGICSSCASGWTHEHNYPVHDGTGKPPGCTYPFCACKDITRCGAVVRGEV